MSNDLALARPAFSTKNMIGLGLALLLGILDVLNLVFTSDGSGPPDLVGIADTVLGVVTVVAVIWAWRTRSRVAARVVAGSRILSAITALPAFFVEGVPVGWVVAAAAFVLLTVVVVGLVLTRPAAREI